MPDCLLFLSFLVDGGVGEEVLRWSSRHTALYSSRPKLLKKDLALLFILEKSLCFLLSVFSFSFAKRNPFAFSVLFFPSVRHDLSCLLLAVVRRSLCLSLCFACLGFLLPALFSSLLRALQLDGDIHLRRHCPGVWYAALSVSLCLGLAV